MRIIVTEASGFVGSVVVPELLRAADPDRAREGYLWIPRRGHEPMVRGASLGCRDAVPPRDRGSAVGRPPARRRRGSDLLAPDRRGHRPEDRPGPPNRPRGS